MEINSISVSVSKTVQVKQYEPVAVTVSLTASVDKKDNFQECRDALHKKASTAVSKLINAEIEKYQEE